jgi:hypothetical protein
MREYHGLMITANSILISLPLIGLSVLANASWIPHSSIAIVAFLEVVSVVMFAVSLLLTIDSVGNYLKGAGIYAALVYLEDTTKEEKMRVDAKFGVQTSADIKDSIPEAIQSYKESKVFHPGAVYFFEAGLLFLVISLLALVLSFLG